MLSTRKRPVESESTVRFELAPQKTLLFGDFRHYDPEQSIFINLFHITRADPMEHFSKLILLRHLVLVPHGHPDYGFINHSSIEDYMCQIGFSVEHVKSTVSYLFDKGYIDTKEPNAEFNASDLLRITDRGSYMIKGLITQFVYYDAVVVDTPILDQNTRKSITDVFPITQRLERCELFMSYLDLCSESIQDSSFLKFWKSISEKIKDEITVIRKRA
ncbi:MAG: hypothetical protein JKY95_01235 [Planctomycetaceae bacterium]|nr:hypothetical protein [Planctomycetaceae bacterium]